MRAVGSETPNSALYVRGLAMQKQELVGDVSAQK